MKRLVWSLDGVIVRVGFVGHDLAALDLPAGATGVIAELEPDTVIGDAMIWRVDGRLHHIGILPEDVPNAVQSVEPITLLVDGGIAIAAL